MENSKFIPVNTSLSGEEFWLIVANSSWFVTNRVEIEHWCKEAGNSGFLQGMILRFKTDEDRLSFIMRWSND